MATHLTTAIDKLKRMLLELAAFTEEQVQKGISAFSDQNELLAQEVLHLDDQLDKMEVDLEEECLKTLALYQPVAFDLRFIIAVLKINNDLERIGDLAVNMAERCLDAPDLSLINPPFDFMPMATKTVRMLKKSIDALIKEDGAIAREVIMADREINQMHGSNHLAVYAELPNQPGEGALFMVYLSISRYLERMGDLATNIAEDVIYLIDGEIVRHRGKVI